MVYTLPAEERIRRRFTSSRYIFSKAGIPKILAIILFLVAGILFLTQNDSRAGCGKEGGDIGKPPDWFPWLFPLATVSSATISAVIYAAFVLEFAKKSLAIWIILDITLSLLLILANLVISILIITSCSSAKTVDNIPGPLGLAGTALLILSEVATYFMWRYRKEDGDASRSSAQSGTRTQSVRSRNHGVRESISALEVDKGEYGV